MAVIQKLLISIVALIHFVFMWVEMFRWEERGPDIFPAFPPEFFPQTSAMAANQGLYNGFLAAGLIWSLLIGDAAWAKNIVLFFLGCVLIAGLYGAATVTKRILYVQTIPAALAIAAVLFT